MTVFYLVCSPSFFNNLYRKGKCLSHFLIFYHKLKKGNQQKKSRTKRKISIIWTIFQMIITLKLFFSQSNHNWCFTDVFKISKKKSLSGYFLVCLCPFYFGIKNKLTCNLPSFSFLKILFFSCIFSNIASFKLLLLNYFIFERLHTQDKKETIEIKYFDVSKNVGIVFCKFNLLNSSFCKGYWL